MSAARPPPTAREFPPFEPAPPGRPLYTPEERARRDASGWTLVQGVLAPVQFLVFLVSLALVLRFLLSGEGWFWEIGRASCRKECH